jgi:hypothetical protein
MKWERSPPSAFHPSEKIKCQGKGKCRRGKGKGKGRINKGRK